MRCYICDQLDYLGINECCDDCQNAVLEALEEFIEEDEEDED